MRDADRAANESIAVILAPRETANLIQEQFYGGSGRVPV